MNDNQKSKHQLLDASLITALASFILMILGFLKNKVAATLIGPAGFGQISLLQSLITTAATIISFGTQNAVPRQIAKNLKDKNSKRSSISSAILIFLALAVFGAVACLLFAHFSLKSKLVKNIDFNDLQFAFCVGFSILSTGLLSILNSTGRIKDSSLSNVIGTAIGTLLGIIFLWSLNLDGVLLFLLAPSLLVSIFCIFQLKSFLPINRASIDDFNFTETKETFRLGFSYLGTAIVATFTQLGVRIIIGDSLGEDKLGYASAALAISGSYMAVIVSSVGSNFFPKLSGAIENPMEANELIRNQIAICYSIGFWILLFFISLPIFVISFLFSKEFQAASTLLQYLVLADFFKILSWILSYSILSKGLGRLYFLNELLGSAIYIVTIYWLIDSYDLDAVGWGSIARYVACFLIAYFYCKKVLVFNFGKIQSKKILLKFLILIAIFSGLTAGYTFFSYLGLVLAIGFSSGFFIRTAKRIKPRIKN